MPLRPATPHPSHSHTRARALLLTYHRYQEQVDLLYSWPDTDQGKKDRYLVRSLSNFRRGCGESCLDASAFIRGHESVMAGEANLKEYGRLGGGSFKFDGEAWANGITGKQEMPGFAFSFTLIMINRIFAIFHPARFAFGGKIQEILLGVLSPMMQGSGLEKAALKKYITGEYYAAIQRSTRKCYSLGKHTCLDSLVMSTFRDWLTDLKQFVFAM